jgi:PBSX family phage terminase large subunit
MELHLNQSIIAKDNHRFRVVNCGRRFGKTVLASEEMIGMAVADNDRRVAYYAPTRDDAREIMWNMIIKRCEPITTYKNESLLQIKLKTQKGGESLIALYGWESVQERGKGRGLANDFIVLDELAQYRNFWVGWDEVLSPTLVDRKGSALFISTPKGFNHFYDLYNFQEKNKDFKSFAFTSYDNPFIPVEELQREKETKPNDVFEQEYLASFKKTQGIVYPEFSRERHITTDEPKSVVKTICGIDFGHTNPAAIVPIRIDSDNHYWIGEEWYKTRQTTEQIIQKALSYKATEVYPDPAEPDRIEEMKRAGLNTREVSKDIVNGINRVRELFKQNRIHIHPDCKNLIWELETYRYPDKKPEKNEEEKPVKENDHALDALRYALYTVTPVSNRPKRIRHKPIPYGLSLKMTNY